MNDTNKMAIHFHVSKDGVKDDLFTTNRVGQELSFINIIRPDTGLQLVTAELRDSSGKRWRCVFEELPQEKSL